MIRAPIPRELVTKEILKAVDSYFKTVEDFVSKTPEYENGDYILIETNPLDRFLDYLNKAFEASPEYRAWYNSESESSP